MTTFFPVSGVETPLWLPPAVAFAISFFTSMGGVSGAFLLLPFQISVLGYTAPSVSATNHIFNVSAIPGGVYRYIREGRMVWPLALTVIAGSLPGVVAGAWVRTTYLPDPKNFKLFAGGVLFFIGARLALDLVKRRKGKTPAGPEIRHGKVRSRITLRRGLIEFGGATHTFSTASVFGVCLVVGMVGGIYGIGGGAIVAPLLVAVFDLPVYVVAGAALMGTFFSSLVGLVTYHVLDALDPAMHAAPDWCLGLLFGAGGLIGMYAGARTQKRVPARFIKTVLAASILFVAVKYVAAFFC